MAKRLKEAVDLDSIGVKVTEMKFARSGAISMSVGEGAGAAEAAVKLRVAVEAVLGADAGIRVRSNTLRLQIVGICRDDDPTDVRSGVLREGIPAERVHVWRMKPMCGGNQLATVEVPEHAGLQTLKKGKLRVGLVYCKVRLELPRIERCYRCHGYGHRAAGCKRPSREEECMTCGEKGHQSRPAGGRRTATCVGSWTGRPPTITLRVVVRGLPESGGCQQRCQGQGEGQEEDIMTKNLVKESVWAEGQT